MPTLIPRLAVLAVASSAALAAGAQAQESSPNPSSNPPAAGEQRLQAVVVTGVKEQGPSRSTVGLDLSGRDTPQSITVIERSRIDDFALHSVNDLLGAASGVSVERVETDRTYYTARGFDITNFQFDGIGMPFTSGSLAGDLDMAVFERVEVLRGANGLLSGTGNPSATVNFVRKRPTAALQASAELTLGSWNDRRIEGDLSGPLNRSGSVRGRLIVVGQRKDSYLDRYGVDKTVLCGLVDVDLAAGTRLSFGHLEQRNNATSPMWGALPLSFSDGTPTHYEVSTSTATDWAFWNNADRRTHAELTHDLGGDWQVKALVSHRTLASDAALFYVYGTPDPASGLGLAAYPSAFAGAYAQSVADLRLSGPLTLAGRTHQLLAGLNWGKEKARERSDDGQGIGTPLPDLATWDGHFRRPSFDAGTDGSTFDTRRRSAYAAAQLRATDTLAFLLGANATQASSRGTSYGVAHAYRRSAVTPYAGTVLDVSDATSLYASFTSIFNPQTEVDAHHAVLAPIQGRSVEAGIKSAWPDRRLAASLAVFRTQQKNTAEAAGSFADFKTYYRGVNAVATGFEAQASAHLAHGWDLDAGYTQLRLKGDDGKDARTFVPRRTLHVATTYGPQELPSLKLGAGLRWQSGVRTAANGTAIRQKAYALLDLMARYALGRGLSLTLNVDNAASQKYLTSLYWTQAYYGAPRSLSATLQWTY